MFFLFGGKRMLIAFQVILMLLTVLFSLGLFANDVLVFQEDKNRYLSIVLASLIALSVSFWVV